MICPFIVGTEFTYAAVVDKDGNTEYLQKEQRAVYPPCYEDECPYYAGFNTCERVNDD